MSYQLKTRLNRSLVGKKALPSAKRFDSMAEPAKPCPPISTKQEKEKPICAQLSEDVPAIPIPEPVREPSPEPPSKTIIIIEEKEPEPPKVEQPPPPSTPVTPEPPKVEEPIKPLEPEPTPEPKQVREPLTIKEAKPIEIPERSQCVALLGTGATKGQRCSNFVFKGSRLDMCPMHEGITICREKKCSYVSEDGKACSHQASARYWRSGMFACADHYKKLINKS